jgi:hypothetical protein
LQGLRALHTEVAEGTEKYSLFPSVISAASVVNLFLKVLGKWLLRKQEGAFWKTAHYAKGKYNDEVSTFDFGVNGCGRFVGRW